MHIACNHGNNIWRLRTVHEKKFSYESKTKRENEKPGIDPHETITNALKYINFKNTSFLLATNEPSGQKRSKM